MERYGVSSGTVDTRDDLVRALGYLPGDVVVQDKSRSDSIIALLTSSAVTSLLLIAGLVALYLEITSPGFGVPGTIALICFSVVFGASGLMGNLGPIEIIMFIIGVVLLLLEIFIIPGFGIAGIAGIVLVLGSFVFSLQSFYWPQFDWQWTIARRNLGLVGLSLVGGLGLIALLMTLMPRASLFDRLVLHGPDNPAFARDGRPGGSRRGRKKDQTRNAPEGPKPPEPDKTSPEVMPGSRGTALTDLRPVGKVRFGDQTVVAETDGEYCGKGAAVAVLRIDGIRIVVAEEGK
jgi:membrane-bound serine protease (ClpP class)